MFQTFSLDCLTLEDGTDRLYRKSININLSYVTPRRANILERFYGSQAPWPQGKKCVWYIKAVLCLYMDDRNYEPVSYLLNQGTKLTTGQLVKKKKVPFVAPEGSLSRSQESTTGPYPETDEYLLPTYKIEAVIIVLCVLSDWHPTQYLQYLTRVNTWEDAFVWHRLHSSFFVDTFPYRNS